MIGYNDTFKDERFSDTYNQWTKSIPLARLRDRIIYLADQEGIETKVVNEAYTSKASYLDGDELTKGEFSGKTDQARTLPNKKRSFDQRRSKRRFEHDFKR
ncbi:MAG: transposase [Anaerotruncus sp.]|nr:transposase [Anaerotruncus sp.]